MRVLVVEDEELLAPVVARGLRQAGMAVDVAADGRTALQKIEIHGYDVVVLDRDLPVIHGDDVCRQILTQPSAPRILMLTASGTVQDRVEGLSVGADDYLGKPFAFEELLARIRALGRRPPAAKPPVLRKHDVTLDSVSRTATRGDRVLRLTRKEFGVLHMLMASDGAVISQEELLEHVWDENADPFTNTIRVTVMNLRRKLGDPPLIDTVIGAGYRM
ncbi:MAG TPA: response regulator transcription factor [Actinomycetota bacterium]